MHTNENLLELYLREGLNASGVSKVECHLRSCEICSARLLEADFFKTPTAGPDRARSSVNSEERRCLPRITTNDAASIQQIHPFSVDRTYMRVLDISRGGMRLQSSVSFSYGTFVKILIRTAIGFGAVRYCVTAQNEFQLGILLQDLLSL